MDPRSAREPGRPWLPFVLAAVSSVSLVLLFLFWHDIGDGWGDVAGGLTVVALGALWVAALVVAALHASRSTAAALHRWGPAALQLTSGFVALALTAMGVQDEVDFRVNRKDRLAVVALAEQGALPGARPEWLRQLPAQYRRLSTGGGPGRVMVDRHDGVTKVLFYRYKGFFPHEFSGFAYTADGSAPGERDFHAYSLHSQALEPHWYWVTSR